MTMLAHTQEVWRDFPASWFICGGHALDLFLGYPIRPRDDVDVGIFRADALLLPRYFSRSVFSYAVPGGGGLRPWSGEPLALPVHEIHFDAEGLSCEVLLNECDSGIWTYRRNERVSMPIDRALLTTQTGLRYLAPEIVLLYKSKHLRKKDQDDYQAVAAHLQVEQRDWLCDALAITTPADHPWRI